MEDDWDLFAVVRRGCTAVTTASAAIPNGGCSFFPKPCLEDPFEPTRVNLYNPFFPNSQNPSSRTVPSLFSQTAEKSPIQTGPKPKQQPFSVTSGSRTNPASRSKRRKNHLKKVCHVAAENLSSDMWSWRKYGQKPIKGSPYPRGYYRCSTSKGCLARKQVERNRSDPGMFIITYTAEHNHPMPTHRNSLAGVTRQKVAAEEPTVTGAEDDDDDNISATNTVLEDDFFAGLEDVVAFAAAGCGESHFPAAVLFPWSAATAAGGCG